MSDCCQICWFRRKNECHRSPPVRLPRAFAPEASAGNRVRTETLIWGWPEITGDDWCGEFHNNNLAASEVLKHYADQFCEGWCKGAPPGASFIDCSGCLARLCANR